jgi:uncharacterized protein YegP (UPF0339 family)
VTAGKHPEIFLEMRAMDYRFVILHRPSGFYVSIRHANGQVLYVSEAYTTRQAATETLQNFVAAIQTWSDEHPTLKAVDLLDEVVTDEEPEPAVEPAVCE